MKKQGNGKRNSYLLDIIIIMIIFIGLYLKILYHYFNIYV